MNKLLVAILLFCVGNVLIWIQTNGQFLWKWFDKNPIFLSIFFGGFISYFFIFATKHCYTYFDGLLWPGRFLGFALGISSYAVLTWIFMGEGISIKTMTSLILALGIICVQIFWK